MRLNCLVITHWIIFFSLLLSHHAAFAQSTKTIDYLKKFPISFISDSPYSYPAIDAKDYRNVSLNILTLAPPVIGEPTQLHAQQFEQLTGAKLNITSVSSAELFNSLTLAFSNRQPIPFDIVVFSPIWAADFMPKGYLEALPESFLKSNQWQKIMPIYQALQQWNGRFYSAPIDGDKLFMCYRTDAFENQNYQKRFKEKFDYDLTPPQTWKQYYDTAEFFSDWDWDNDKEREYGLVEMTQREGQVFWQFVARAAPYCKHPQLKNAIFFNPDTMKPLINSPCWTQALKDMLAVKRLYPPDGLNFTLADAIFTFARGQAALLVNWDDGLMLATNKDSNLRNKIATALSPGAHKVWNTNIKQWEEVSQTNYAPFIALGGWSMGVTANSKNKEAAFNFIGFFSNPENCSHDLTIGRYGINPYRITDLDEKFWTSKLNFSPKLAHAYTQTLKTSLYHPNRVLDLRIPNNQLYVRSLSNYISKALNGNLKAQEALDAAAKEWHEITLKTGLEQQKQAYSALLKLENLEFKEPP